MLFVSALARAAAAQTAGRVDAAGGYSWMRDHDGAVTFSRGWFASVGVDVIGPLGVVGDANASYEAQRGLDVEFSMRVVSVMGGPRVAMHGHRLTPFAQLLFGTTRFTTTYRLLHDTLSDSQSHFAIQFGGGVDVHLVNHLAGKFGAHRRLIPSDTFTPTGSRPFTYRETQWFAGLAVR